MKFFIATDIHGSAYWAQKVVEKFRQTNADVLVILGDIYNHGPRNPFPQDYAPMKVAEILNGVADKIVAIQGNCDSEVDQMISDFDFVRESVQFVEGRRFFFTHGHVFNKNNLPKLAKGDVVFYGHFHICEIVDNNGVMCVNVGSCALPKDFAAYCIADEKGVAIWSFENKLIAQKQF